VATGFSYVEDEALVVRSDEDAAADLTALLKELFNGNETLQKSPLYIFAESYGGKFAATLGVSALKAIEAGELKLQLGGLSTQHFYFMLYDCKCLSLRKCFLL
jgi:serine carboxypeptidase 1